MLAHPNLSSAPAQALVACLLLRAVLLPPTAPFMGPSGRQTPPLPCSHQGTTPPPPPPPTYCAGVSGLLLRAAPDLRSPLLGTLPPIHALDVGAARMAGCGMLATGALTQTSLPAWCKDGGVQAAARTTAAGVGVAACCPAPTGAISPPLLLPSTTHAAVILGGLKACADRGLLQSPLARVLNTACAAGTGALASALCLALQVLACARARVFVRLCEVGKHSRQRQQGAHAPPRLFPPAPLQQGLAVASAPVAFVLATAALTGAWAGAMAALPPAPSPDAAAKLLAMVPGNTGRLSPYLAGLPLSSFPPCRGRSPPPHSEGPPL